MYLVPTLGYMTTSSDLLALDARLGVGVEFKGIQLTNEERVRFFYWCRDRAIESMRMAKQFKDMEIQYQHLFDESMKYLEQAKDIFPLTQDKETISIEDIIKGKEPNVEY